MRGDPSYAAFNDCKSSFVTRRADFVLSRAGDFCSHPGMADAEERVPCNLPAHDVLSHLAPGHTTPLLLGRSFFTIRCHTLDRNVARGMIALRVYSIERGTGITLDLCFVSPIK